METEHGADNEAPADERAGTDRPLLNHRATSRLYHYGLDYIRVQIVELFRHEPSSRTRICEEFAPTIFHSRTADIRSYLPEGACELPTSRHGAAAKGTAYGAQF